MTIWKVTEVVTGACGRAAARSAGHEMWGAKPLQGDRRVQDFVRGFVVRDGLPAMAELRRRSSGPVKKPYSAFCCPHCQVVSGDFPLQQELLGLRIDGVEPVTGWLPGVGVSVPGRHWCVDVGAGHCSDVVG